MPNPKISVIMPAYNAEKYVDSTLKTLIGQTYKDWEAVVVDGGSTDSTLALLDGYAEHDVRFVIVREKCESPYDAIWKGIKRAKGDFVYILCFSDGYLTDEWYAKCMKVMEKDAEISLVWGIPFEVPEDSAGRIGVLRPHFVYAHFLEGPDQQHQGMVMSRLLKKINIFNPGSFKRLIKKMNWTNINAARKLVQFETPPIKQKWFSYWLETGTIFPDGNMCIAKRVLLECFSPYKGGTDPGDWEDFFFNINSKGYLSACIPVPANFGRLNSGQMSETFSEYNENNRVRYFARLRGFKSALKGGVGPFVFKDRFGNPIVS